MTENGPVVVASRQAATAVADEQLVSTRRRAVSLAGCLLKPHAPLFEINTTNPGDLQVGICVHPLLGSSFTLHKGIGWTPGLEANS